eukprot:TRINITY_DN1923_c0_g1_i2.p1 TRINITY_DN1923_c0_g1~~TRINITY_DN1923_c0_g1_i2.p1  ORF type:complete len:792 (+),score=159.82 TRINITY_DN1923_c0_g1_i2:598-2973(+)
MKNQSANVINDQAILELHALESIILDLVISYENENVTIIDVCEKSYEGGICIVQTIRDFWYSQDDSEYGVTYDGIPNIVNGSSTADLIRRINLRYQSTPLGNYIDLGLVLGGVETDEDDDVVFAKTFLSTFLFTNTPDEEKLKATLEFETAFLETVMEFNKTSKVLNMFVSVERSIEDEINREVSADSSLIAISYAIIIVYVALSLGKFHRIYSKFALGFSGVFVVIVSIFSALGVASIIGIPFSPVSLQVLPYLLLGTGVDDMFIITNSYNDVLSSEWSKSKKIRRLRRKNPNAYVAKAAGRAMREAGPTVALTSIADFVAFMFGAATLMPAVKTFCFQASIAVLIELIMMMTSFLPLTVLDVRRIVNKRVDVFCCVSGTLDKKKGPDDYIGLSGAISKVIGIMTKFVMQTPVKIVFVILFLTAFGISCYGITHVEIGLDLSQAVPKDSYLEPFLQRREEYHDNLGAPIYVILPGDLEYGDLAVQNQIYELQDMFVDSEWIVPPVLSWLDDLHFSVAVQGGPDGYISGYMNLENDTFRMDIPPEDFYDYLSYFMFNDTIGIGKFNRANVKLNDDGTIDTARIMFYSKGLQTTSDFVSSITEIRKMTDTYENFDIFAYSIFHVFFEQYSIIVRETIQNVLLALAGVFVVNIFFLKLSILSSIYCMITICMIVVDTVGVMALWSIELNPLSSVNLVMAVGLGVEFVSHISRSFMLQEGSRDERIKEALHRMGHSVVSGALSTLVGVIILAFAKYDIFNIFYFRMYFTVVTVGLVHGLIFLPIILSWIGPKNK